MLNLKSVFHVYLICLVAWSSLSHTDAYFAQAQAGGGIVVGGGLVGAAGAVIGGAAKVIGGAAAVVVGGAALIVGGIFGGAVALAGGVIGGAAAFAGGFVRGLSFGVGRLVIGTPCYDVSALYKGSGLVFDAGFKTRVDKWNCGFNYPYDVASNLYARLQINVRLGCLASLCVASCPGNNFLFFIDFLGCHHCHCNAPKCPDTACNGGCVQGAQPVMSKDSNGCLQCTCVSSTTIDCPATQCDSAGGCEQGYLPSVGQDSQGCKTCTCNWDESQKLSK